MNKIKCPCCNSENCYVSIKDISSVYSQHPYDIYRCGNCSNCITVPAPSQSELDEIYKNHYRYDGHLAILDEKQLRAKELAQRIRKIFPPNKKLKVLEVGCMYGYLIDELKNDFEVYGIEIDKDAVKHCTCMGLNVRKISLEDYLRENNPRLDIIIMTHVMEHISNSSDGLQKINLLLNESRAIMLSVPNNKSLCAKLFGKYWGWWQVPVHINHFNETSLLSLTNRFHFEKIKSWTQGGDSLMLLLNFLNIFPFLYRENKMSKPKNFFIRLWSYVFKYWYYLGNEKLNIVLSKSH